MGEVAQAYRGCRGRITAIVQFTAKATDPDGTIASYIWTFDDGTYSYAQNPVMCCRSWISRSRFASSG